MINPTMASSSQNQIPEFIIRAADKFQIEPFLLISVCKVESRCTATAINKNDGTKKAKAMGIKEHSHGLFQIKLATAKMLGFEGTAAQLMNPEVNAHYAAKYLRHLMNRYHNDVPKAISAYNAGKASTHNKHYVHKVIKNYINLLMVMR